MAESREWLIMSTKRPKEECVWYADAMSGYTVDLLRAGRYTREEALAEERRVPHHLIAVHLEDALAVARHWLTVDWMLNTPDAFRITTEGRLAKLEAARRATLGMVS